VGKGVVRDEERNSNRLGNGKLAKSCIIRWNSDRNVNFKAGFELRWTW